MDKATIGGAVALDRTTIAVVVKNLEERGLVTTRPSDHDRRAKLIKITAKGFNLLSSSAERGRQRSGTNRRAVDTQGACPTCCGCSGKIAEENNLLSRAPHRAPRAAGA